MYQEPNDAEVYCNETSHSLNTSEGRAEFIRQLYNVRDMLEKDEETGDTQKKISKLQDEVNQHNKQCPMKTFNTKSANSANNTEANKRKRVDRDVGTGEGAGRSATERAELGAHGYEVESPVILGKRKAPEGEEAETFSARRKLDGGANRTS